jgi:hypothetical protein
MGQLLLLLIAELIGLYVLSRRLTQRLFMTFLVLFRHRSFAISAVTILLFPGTVIHELSHLFTAEILGVRTGKLTLAPESIEHDDINVGSVEFRETDPFRTSVIGLAPFFVGLIWLIGLSWILPNLWQDTLTAYNQGVLFSSSSLYLSLLISYLLFAISNTMFASPEDMKGVIPLVAVLGILGTAGYMAGFRVGLTGVLEKNAVAVLSAISKSLSVVLFLNLILYLTTSAGIWIIKRLEGKS